MIKNKCKKLKQVDLNILRKKYSYIKSDEVFRKIEKCSDYYVSQYGNVASTKGNDIKILKQYDNGYGYIQVFLMIRSKRIVKYVHKLVAETWLVNNYPGEEIEVHHIDGNTKHNYISNLMILNSEHHAIENHVKSIALYHKTTDKFKYYKSIEGLATKLKIDVKELYNILRGDYFDIYQNFLCYVVAAENKHGTIENFIIGVKRKKNKTRK
jgi:hypothetical protein